MTEKLFLKDSYLKEFDAIVTKIENGEVLLDRTAFYPTGGGQPSDTGFLFKDNQTFKVTDVHKLGDNVYHVTENSENLKVGDHVKGKIDWDRRYARMRYHTALHIIDGVVFHMGNGTMTGGQIYVDKARADFDIPGLDKDKVLKILEESQKVIDEKHPIEVKFLTKEEAFKIPELARTEPGKELMKKLDTFRIVDIKDFDFQLDGGTHVKNTGEVGKIELSKYENKGSHHKRVEIILK